MKKFIYSILAVLALCSTLVACGSDDGDESISRSTSAEQASAGTYSGTFIRTLDGVTDSGSGTVTLAAGSSAGVTNVTINFTGTDSKGAAITVSGSSPANITYANHGYQFVQQVTAGNDANTLGTAFAGTIDENGVMTLSLNVDQRNGRVLSTYIFAFTGNK